MTRISTNNPILDRQGIGVTPGDPNPPRGSTAKHASSGLTGQFPTFITKAALFDCLPVPDGTANPGDGRSAVRLLRRINIEKDIGQEATLVAATATLAPSDSNAQGSPTSIGVAAAVALGWGDTIGTLAAIIITKNLPIDEGAWRHLDISLPGIEQNATGVNERSNLTEYPIVAWFPPGRFSDATVSKAELRWAFAPYTNRLTVGDTLDVALVVRASQIVNATGAARFIVGSAHINMTIGMMKDIVQFYE